MQAGTDIADRRADQARHIVGRVAVQMEQAGDAKTERIMAGPVAIGPVLAEQRDRAVHQARVARAQFVRPHAKTLHHAGAKTFHQHIAAVGQAPADFLPLRALEVEHDGAAIAPGAVEQGFGLEGRALLRRHIGRLFGAPAARGGRWRLHADHFRAEIAQLHAGECSGKEIADL